MEAPDCVVHVTLCRACSPGACSLLAPGGQSGSQWQAGMAQKAQERRYSFPAQADKAWPHLGVPIITPLPPALSLHPFTGEWHWFGVFLRAGLLNISAFTWPPLSQIKPPQGICRQSQGTGSCACMCYLCLCRSEPRRSALVPLHWGPDRETTRKPKAQEPVSRAKKGMGRLLLCAHHKNN